MDEAQNHDHINTYTNTGTFYINNISIYNTPHPHTDTLAKSNDRRGEIENGRNIINAKTNKTIIDTHNIFQGRRYETPILGCVL